MVPSKLALQDALEQQSKQVLKQPQPASGPWQALREFQPKDPDANAALVGTAGEAGNDEKTQAAQDVLDMEQQHMAIASRSAGRTVTMPKDGKALKRPAAAHPHGQAPPLPDTRKQVGAIYWRQAKVLFSENKGGWRLWLDAKKPCKEKITKVGSDKLGAWKKVIQLIKESS